MGTIFISSNVKTPHGGTCLDFLYLVYIFSMIALRSPS
jgi:hypothetical protein